jgi:hypothetical protein
MGDSVIGPFLKTLWRGWLKFAHVLGTFQMMLILTIIYWLIVPWFAVPMKLLSDPLRFRKPAGSAWRDRQAVADAREYLRREG